MTLDVFCYECGKRIPYIDAFIGAEPYRFFCKEHRGCAAGEIRKVVYGPISAGVDDETS